MGTVDMGSQFQRNSNIYLIPALDFIPYPAFYNLVPARCFKLQLLLAMLDESDGCCNSKYLEGAMLGKAELPLIEL